MTKYAVYGVNAHPDYAFFAPLTAEAWRRIGYESIVLMVGDFTPSMHVVARMLEQTHVRMERIYALPGYRTSTLAQVGRVYGWAAAQADDYVIVGDVDLWPLRREWFEKHEAPQGKLAILYANNPDHFPMCYIAGHGGTWREVLRLGDSTATVQELAHAHLLAHLSPTTFAADAWQHDEAWLTARIRQWPGYPERCVLCKRAEVPGVGILTDRLDRAGWGPRQAQHLDAHLLRPGFKHWATLRGLLADLPAWAEDYVRAYAAAEGHR